MLNRLLQFLISRLNNDSFQNKIGTLRPDHKTFFNITKLIKNKVRCVPALKVGGSIADRFAESRDNSPLTNIVRASCSVLHDGGFNTDTSTYTSSPREIRNVVRGLRNVRAPGDDGINISLLKNLSRKALYF
jgi:hypothetical protein